MHRENHPVAETVKQRAILPLQGESGSSQELLLVAGIECRTAHPVSPGRAESQSELVDRGIRKAPFLTEIGQPDANPLRIVPKVIGKVLGCPAVQHEHTLAVVVAGHLLRGQLLFPHLDAIAFGHSLQRLGIGHSLVFHDEGNRIAAFTASETFENAFRWGDNERRGLLVVKRTARLVIDALAFERHILADNIHDIGSGINSVYCFPVDHTDKDTNISINAVCDPADLTATKLHLSCQSTD